MWEFKVAWAIFGIGCSVLGIWCAIIAVKLFLSNR